MYICMCGFSPVFLEAGMRLIKESCRLTRILEMWEKYGNYAILCYMLVYECPSIMIFSFKLSLFLQNMI